ncbi:MAG: MGMT family protein [Chloroflexi bacterium]|nr:MAG: MGMT family protein [Chloroflexota bacterium]
MEKKRSFVEAVRAVVRDVGRGQVVSYGEVARRAGYPRAARAVGNVLANSLGLPWWRVVRANGELAAHGGEEQARRLRREGVAVRDGRCQPPWESKKSLARHRP